MTRHNCDNCGAEVKNKGRGYYRDKCHRCIIEEAASDNEPKIPMHGCECELCQQS